MFSIDENKKITKGYRKKKKRILIQTLKSNFPKTGMKSNE